MVYMRARYYDPQTQQFISRDPVSGATGHPYVYANRNPVNFIDPTGTTALFQAGGDEGPEVPPPSKGIPGTPIRAGGVEGGAGGSGAAWAAESAYIGPEYQLTKGIANPVPARLARVVAGERTLTTLGREGAEDVFVTAAEDIEGLNAKQLAERLTIRESEVYTVVEFDTPASGLGSPIRRADPGFLGGGRTAGGAREFVIPNGPIPPNSVVRIVR